MGDHASPDGVTVARPMVAWFRVKWGQIRRQGFRVTQTGVHGRVWVAKSKFCCENRHLVSLAAGRGLPSSLPS